MKKIVLLVFIIGINLFAMDKAQFGINVNSDDLEVEGRTSLGFLSREPSYRNFYVNGDFINAKESLFSLGLYVENAPINYQNLSFSVGLKALFSSKKNDNFSAIPITLGAKARMYLGNLPKSYLGLKFAYAPSPLTFQDADSYIEYRIETDMNVIQNVDLYVGYRNIHTNYKHEDWTYNSSYYIGFKFVLY